MRRSLGLAAFVCAASVLASPALGAQGLSALDAAADSAMAGFTSPGSPGGVVAVVRGGEVVFAKGYGSAHLEHDAPITPETVFYIGSVSKQFTAFAAALLAEQGRIDLDADVQTYLPELDLDRPVTVRQLVHHTSGLRDSFGLLSLAGVRDGDLVTQEIVRDLVLRQRGLNAEPGAAFGYSNSNYIALAEIVERVTGEPFRAWMEEAVFGPLGMAQTFVGDDHREVVLGRAASYAPRGRGYRTFPAAFSAYGAGGIYSTVGDLARWLGNLGTHEVGGSAVARQVLERGVLADGDTLSYAFGLFLDEHRGLRRVQHGGALAGYRAFLAYYPEIDAGVVALGNVTSFDGRAVAERVAEAAFAPEMGAPPPPEAVAADPDPVDLADPDAYVGTYYSPEMGMMLYVGRDSTGLTFGSDVASATELRPLSDTLFLDVPFGVRVRFDLGPGGQATGGAVLLGEGLPFVRQTPWLPGPDVLARYAGRYVSSELDTEYAVRVEDGGLVVSHPRLGDDPLVSIRQDEFASKLLGTVRVVRDASGTITGLRSTGPRASDVLFDRRE